MSGVFFLASNSLQISSEFWKDTCPFNEPYESNVLEAEEGFEQPAVWDEASRGDVLGSRMLSVWEHRVGGTAGSWPCGWDTLPQLQAGGEEHGDFIWWCSISVSRATV